MRYLVFGEMKKGIMDKDFLKEVYAIQEKRQEKGETMNTLFASHAFLTEPSKGFAVYEAENEEEIIKHQRAYGHLMKMKYIPIVEISKLMVI